MAGGPGTVLVGGPALPPVRALSPRVPSAFQRPSAKRKDPVLPAAEPDARPENEPDGPLVSAVVPAYERPRRTQRAIDSVADQCYRPMELIVVDDGSEQPLEPLLTLPTDALSRAVVERHAVNRGANAARKRGVEVAEGEYLAFLDSDDAWRPEKTRRQVERLEGGNRFQASYTGVRHFGSDGRLNAVRYATASGDLLGRLLRGDPIGSYSRVIVARSAVEAAGPPDPEMPCWQDWEWYMRLAAAGVAFDAVRRPLVDKHHGGDQIARNYEVKRERGYPLMERRIREVAPTSREARVGVAYLRAELGKSALKARRYGEARRLLARAILDYPAEPAFYTYLAAGGPHYPAVRRLKRWVVRLLS